MSKYILLYNHYDNSEHSDRDASDIYQVIGHAKCECVCVCRISSWFRPVQELTQEKTIPSPVSPLSRDHGNVILDLILPLRRGSD